MTRSRNQLNPTTTDTTSGHRVLFLIDRLHSIEGGAEGAVHKLCRFLPVYGFQCSVATFWAGQGVERLFPCPVRVLALDRTYDWTALQKAVAFGRLLRSERVEIVHTFFAASDLWGGLVARLSGCPILVSSRRDMGILRTRKQALPYRLVNRLFDQVQAVSEKVREFSISQDHLPPERVATVYNGIDLDAIDAALPADRSALTADLSAPIVVTVANMRFVKGIDVLVNAAARVRERVPDATFVVIGGALEEPSCVEKVNAAVRHLRLAQNFKFLGTRTDVASLLKSSDVFCLPSRSEGMSNALLEAMACGLPCVATQVGGNAEVVTEGGSGFLVPSEDPDALAARIVTLLGDRERAQQMGQEGRRIVESKFTVRHMLERLTFLYHGLLRDRGLLASPGSTEAAWEALPAEQEEHQVCG
jgi:L-malate glycosyltransferase